MFLMPERLVSLKNARVAVIGDVMVDEYLTGHVSRISPEAPVPVVRGVATRAVPGGAANVVANVAGLGALAVLVGVVGADGKQEIDDILKPMGRVRTDLLVSDITRRTTRKVRVISNGQQIVRIDHEDVHALPPDVERKLLGNIELAVEMSDIVVISDYGKGLLSDDVLAGAISFARIRGKPIIVDPKRNDFSAYRGADVIAPNRSELARASGLPVDTDAQAEAAARKVMSSFDGAVLVTRSEQGMSYFRRDEPPLHVSTVAREVFDVSGAGDTVVATLATAWAAGFAIGEAIILANQAAGVVVAKAGTAAISYHELSDALHVGRSSPTDQAPLASWPQAKEICENWVRQGLTIGFANGCFDILHPGHISLIRQAAAACDRLVLALNSDASVKRLKGPARPAQSETARAEVIGALKGVALVVLFEQDTPQELIETLRPHVLVKGADYQLSQVVGADFVQSYGGKVLLIDLVDDQSTSRLLENRK